MKYVQGEINTFVVVEVDCRQHNILILFLEIHYKTRLVLICALGTFDNITSYDFISVDANIGSA
ncbi:hypothetical protein BLOT_007139 [Blomia tropicalis]|nr:hypothetical protein BLOT_007139 [Blomia tropicalis]